MSDCKYPEIKVELIGNDGNAFSILGSVKRALKNGGVSTDEITKFYEEATSGDYNHLLQVVMSWVEITGEDEEEREIDPDDESQCPDCCKDFDDCTCDEEDEEETCEFCGETWNECECDTDENDNRNMLKDCGIK